MDNKQLAESLRFMADFFEKHPEVPSPGQIDFSVYVGQELKSLARPLGICRKEADQTFFNLKKAFGDITVTWFAYRNDVCEKVSKGKKIVPETVVPAKPEQVIPAHEIEEFEWKCPESFLAANP